MNVRSAECGVRRWVRGTWCVARDRLRQGILYRPPALPPYRRVGLILALLATTAVAPADAQRPFRPDPPPQVDDEAFGQFNVPYDGRFTFVRLRYTPSRTSYGGGGGYFGGINFQWDHDYPRADRNFTQMIDELTGVRATTEGSNILSVGDPDLFKYPLAYLVEPGFLTLTDAEADNLGAYLRKGGFLIFDDFAEYWAYNNLENMLGRILPGGLLVQLTAEHPIFHSFFDIESLDFRHPYYGLPSAFFGIYEDNDPDKRLLLVVNYNNDIGESWEYSDTDFIPIEISNVAYKLGVNYVMYSMTH